jgi:hypothetical protein
MASADENKGALVWPRATQQMVAPAWMVPKSALRPVELARLRQIRIGARKNPSTSLVDGSV